MELIMSTTKLFSDTLHEWTHTIMRRSFHDFKEYMDAWGLSISQANALMRLYHSGACGVSDIGDHVGISNAAASQMIDRLVQMGLVERKENLGDRRVRHLSLTEKGRSLAAKGVEAHSRWMENLGETLTESQKAEICSALAQLIEAANQIPTE
jgi:DNA-binding MarR family transcriptional regulator